MPVTILSSLLLAGVALPAADAAAIEARVKQIFRPYSLPSEPKAVWQNPVFSAETTALIAHWVKVQPRDEVDDLNDGDWFCLCQDWDRKKFRATPGPANLVGPDLAEVSVRVELGFDEPRNERLVLKKEANGWRVDDLFADPEFAQGLKQALRDTIRTDEAMKR
jgi:hypothetical protein